MSQKKPFDRFSPILRLAKCTGCRNSSDQGEIHKVVHWTEGGHGRSRLVSVWKPFEHTVTSIKTMKLHVSSKKICDLFVSNDLVKCTSV